MKILIMLIFSFCVMHFTGCTKSKEKDSGNAPQNQGQVSQKDGLNSAGVKEGGHEFTVRYPAQRRIYKLEKEDLNDDGTKEIIVLSVALDTSDKYSDYYNFDMIEVFALNTDKNSYVKILSDTVDYSEECSFVDLANDKKKQILISTNSGGNDDIVSVGMFIYDMTSKDTIKLLKYFDSGAPEVRDIKRTAQIKY
ncbi:MAG: hypothetical protein IPL53_11255 [Ignavibacteria bacterium]|nr:hypothetical protein [Ignavibacteria bacterium]